MALLLIEHDMDIVFEVASHISVLHFGEILESGPAERVRSSAKVREVYLGSG
jgi:branched-chain amino acid transport system ATP-binding protein